MQRSLWSDFTEYVKNNRFRSAWRKVVQVLACVVVFCTTYALILPAITMEQKSYCGYEEHEHIQKCYDLIPVASELICPLVEGEFVDLAEEGLESPKVFLTVSDGDGEVLVESEEIPRLQPHTHTEECYVVPKEPPLTCKLTEGEDHKHEFLCYGSWELTCNKDAHTHILECFSDSQADVEGHVAWENMVNNMDLTGIWAEDVVTIARSQMGYEESARNYKVNEDTTVNGYTRYGAWGGDPYADWDVLFASFCLYYAGVEDMPLGEDCNTWIQELSEMELYCMAADGKPRPGDILFMDEDKDGMADHTAVFSEYVEETENTTMQIKAVQGNVWNQVQYVTYEVGDQRILGYGMLPKQPDSELTYRYSDETLQVEVELPEGTRVPRNAVLTVTAIEENSQKYAELLSQAEEAVSESVVKAQFYDISFYTPRKEYIPVSEKAKVSMCFREDMVDPDANTVVLHYDENDSAPVVLDEVNVEEQTVTTSTTFASQSVTPIGTENSTVVTYETEGFSVFGVLETYNNLQPEDLVTGLDGEIVMIVAVNNYGNEGPDKEGTYWARTLALSSVVDNVALKNTQFYSGEYQNGPTDNFNITDDNNNLVWEFEAGTKPGSYYIKVANIYGEPKNDNAGRYIYFEGTSIKLGNKVQEFEVVKGDTVDDGSQEFTDVVCLRTMIGDRYRYIQLGQNSSGWGTFNSLNFGENNEYETTGFPGNHYILVELSDKEQEGQVVNRLNEILEQLPGSEAEYIAMTEPAGSTFTQQVVSRENLRRLVMEAMALCNEKPDSLSGLQKNFIGQERFEKLKNLKTNMEWLWRENPSVVENKTTLEATINLFNYDESVNNKPLADLQDNPFTFYDYTDRVVEEDGNILDQVVENNNRKTKDGIGDLAGEFTIPKMNPQLVNGYPYIDGTSVDGSLKYLFDTSNQNYHKGTMTDGGGLFQMDADGYYYYYSDQNAAWYDEKNKRFELYNVAIRPEFTRPQYDKEDSETPEGRGNFYPFNNILNGGNNDVSNVIYDDFEAGEPLASGIQTAFLNDVTDLWFGMTIEYDFFIPKDKMVNDKDMVFNFHGDDDVFVYIDDVLILDLGATHTALEGTINFTKGLVEWQYVAGVTTDENTGVTTKVIERTSKPLSSFFTDKENSFDEYTIHNLKFYLLERGGTYSYAGIRFNMPTIPENSLLVGKDLRKGNDQVIDAELDYRFRIVNANNTSESFVGANESYMIYEDGEYLETKKVDAEGYFTLKAGQRALFPGLLEPTNGTSYIVQEIMPANIDGQYTVLYCEGENSNTFRTPDSFKTNDPYIYQTKVYSTEEGNPDYTEAVIFVNDVSGRPLDELNITKVAGENTTINPADKKFNIGVQVGNDQSDLIPLPTGTVYTISKDGQEIRSGTVTSEGIIQLGVGEKVTIRGFLAGTYWTVTEILGEGEDFSPVYSGQASGDGTIYYDGENFGTFGLGGVMSFTVTNYAYAFLIEVPIEKTAIGNTGVASFNFAVEQGNWKKEKDTEVYVWTPDCTLPDASITVSDDKATRGKITIGFASDAKGDNFYKISEQPGNDQFIYDETYYIVQIKIDDRNKTSRIEKVWKNGINGIEEFPKDRIPEALSFGNYKTIPLTIAKEVINASNAYDTGGIFSFEATVTINVPDGQPVPNIPASVDRKYKVEGNKVKFDLSHNQQVTIPIPMNATVTVTETNKDGYKTSYQVIKGGTPEATHSGTKVTVDKLDSDTTIHFINQTGYELPATGGRGTHLYRLGGCLLLAIAAGWWYFKRRSLS